LIFWRSSPAGQASGDIMSIGLWIVVVGCAALIAAPRLRGLRTRRLHGRTLRWKITVRRDGRLAARGWRLRLYGIAMPQDERSLQSALAVMRAAMLRGPIRLRVLSRDPDGTLVALMRCVGADQGVALLRAGLASTRGTGARRQRIAQYLAQQEACGQWRVIEPAPPHRPRNVTSSQPQCQRWWSC